jgi:hypothetical protein
MAESANIIVLPESSQEHSPQRTRLGEANPAEQQQRQLGASGQTPTDAPTPSRNAPAGTTRLSIVQSALQSVHSASQCVCCRILLYGIKRAASGGTDVAEFVVRLTCPPGRSRSLRAASGRARAGRPGERGTREEMPAVRGPQVAPAGAASTLPTGLTERGS